MHESMVEIPKIAYNGHPFAVPAYRILLYFDEGWAEPRMRHTAEAVIRAFVRTAEAHLGWVMFADEPAKLKAQQFTTEAIDRACEWLYESALGFGASVRFHGPIDDEMRAPTVPHLRIEQNTVTIMEVCLSADTDLCKLITFSDEVVIALEPNAPLCGLMGYGFYVPDMLTAMAHALPIAYRRFRAATEVQIGGPIVGMKRPKSKWVKPWSLHPDLEPGIADIGWRTIIGNPFLKRLSDLSSATLPETVEITEAVDHVVIQAGPAPIWGDLNAGEDISAYSAVAVALRPVRAPFEISVRGLFGAKTDDPKGRDQLEAYLARFDGGEAK